MIGSIILLSSSELHKISSYTGNFATYNSHLSMIWFLYDYADMVSYKNQIIHVSYEHHIRIIWKLWYDSYLIEFSYDPYIISTWLWKELHIRIIRSKIASIAFDYLSVCPFVRLFVNFSHFHLPQPLGQFQQHFAQQIFR